MKYNIQKNWLGTIDLIVKNPIVFLPFIIIGFLETLVLEMIYFSVRWPIAPIMNPVMRKFFGEASIHYPGNLAILPRLFYYNQIGIYILISVFLIAISIQIFKNIKADLPLVTNALIRNASKRYLTFAAYGFTVIIFMIIAERCEVFIFVKFVRLLSRHLISIPQQIYLFFQTLLIFFTNIIIQILLVLTVPLIVIEKQPLFKSIAGSLTMALGNLLTIIGLLIPPFLLYLPIVLLKAFSFAIINKTFPEINLLITFLGIVVSMFVDCFIFLSASQFLLDKKAA